VTFYVGACLCVCHHVLSRLQYGISTECTHFYCATCITDYLSTLLEQGTVPAFCPGCLDNAPPDQAPEAGRIEGKALTFLQQHGVITQEFQFQFERLQHRDATDLFFKCPNPECSLLLVDVDPRFDFEGNEIKMRVEKCPCGKHVCVSCHQLVPAAQARSHACPKAPASSQLDVMKSVQLMRKIGKKCPRCVL